MLRSVARVGWQATREEPFLGRFFECVAPDRKTSKAWIG